MLPISTHRAGEDFIHGAAVLYRSPVPACSAERCLMYINMILSTQRKDTTGTELITATGRKIADGLDANGICFEWRTHEITFQDILNDGNVEG
jgi:hypothetical protein